MSVKFSSFSLTATALGLMVCGCSHKAPIQAKATVPVPAQSAPVDSGRSQSASNNNTPSSSTTSTTRPSNSGISDDERNRLNKSLAKLEDVLFDYDKATIRTDAVKALEEDVSIIRATLQRYPSQKVKIEGHADERGSDEYNIALGDKRAVAAKEFLAGMGISASQLDIVSFGKQRPVCGEHTEDCWQKNRRAHLVAETASN